MTVTIAHFKKQAKLTKRSIFHSTLHVGVMQELGCKLITVGDSKVGKTSVSRQFTDNKFSYQATPTIGMECHVRIMNVSSKLVTVKIWDTAGQERFRSMTVGYYRGAKGVIFVYDITKRKTFEQVKSWCRIFDEWGDKDAEKMLVGNKCDLEEERQVEMEEGEKLAKDLGMMFHETSAKDDVNVTEVFMKLLGKIINRVKQAEQKIRFINQATTSSGIEETRGVSNEADDVHPVGVSKTNSLYSSEAHSRKRNTALHLTPPSPSIQKEEENNEGRCCSLG
ncbi:ras-related protein Rab-10-like [Clavelina lepadiformis]|uniref:ras-related protein Rab-10-like n=1 Tax=Clavelina lepadiformis TaxID=159417 RepID=UPI0040429360